MNMRSLLFALTATFLAIGRAEVVVSPDAADVSAVVRAGIDRLRTAGGGVLRFEKGEYHFRPEGAVPVRLYISNHDKLPVHPVHLPLTNLVGVTVDGGGSRFVFHGQGIAALVMDSERVTLKGFTVDWSRPYNTEFTVLGHEDGRTLVSVDEGKYPVALRDGKLFAVGEGWSAPTGYGIVFEARTHEILERVASVRFDGTAERRGKGRYLLGADLSRIGLHGAKPGDVFVSRPCTEPWRPHPAIAVYRAKDTVVEDVVLQAAFGMGVLAQRSENFTMRGTGKGEKTCGVWPAEGRMCAQMVDATHFVSVKGKVSVSGCRFERMLDDAINVHSTGLGIVSNPAPNVIVCRGMHEQGWGFEMFRPGERLRFIKVETLENRGETVVTAVRALSPRETELTLAAPVPAGLGVGDAVENADWQCAVDFTDNVVARNMARGVLFTTPRPVLVKDNLFENVSGSAILLAGDARLWYETGACDGVRVTGNVFRNCLTSRFQYCEAVITSFPTVEDLARQDRPYHRNLVVEGNIFETFDAPLLFARSVDGVRWRNNRIVENSRYVGWRKPRFQVEGCTSACIVAGGEEAEAPQIVDGTHGYMPDTYVEVTDPLVRAELEKFRDRKLALMMHFGVYTQLGIHESWPLVDAEAHWSRSLVDWTDGEGLKREYLGLWKSFNPVRLEPTRWAALARRDGFRYLVFTTKHHDGFCLFDSKHTDYKVTNPACPFSANPNADIVRRVFDAFRAEGLEISCYFSKPDWHHPDYWEACGLGWKTTRWPSYDVKRDPARWARFVDFTRQQMLELVRDYGPFACLWLDGGQVQRRAGLDIGIEDIVAEVRRIRPGLIVADRTAGGMAENVITPEQTVPEKPLPMPWESCVTMGTGFSYRYDDTYKSPRELIHLLIDVVAKGGNLALNVAPGPDGRLPQPAVDRMDAMGAWLKANGAAIYGTRVQAPYRTDRWAFTRGKDGEAYAICLWQPGERHVVRLLLPKAFDGSRVRKVVHLASGADVPFEASADGLWLDLPPSFAADPSADAFRIERGVPSDIPK